jgi:hypothetical protein
MWNIKLQIPKERTEKYWPRLLKSKLRPPSLVVDWPNWIEDTDDDDGVNGASDDEDDDVTTPAARSAATPKPTPVAAPTPAPPTTTTTTTRAVADSVVGETRKQAPSKQKVAKHGDGDDDGDGDDEQQPTVRLPPPLHFDL